MSTIIEFVTYDEAVKAGFSEEEINDNGFGFEVSIDISEKSERTEIKIETKEMGYIRAFVNGGYMYVTNNGVSFQKVNAKKFEKKEGQKKAINMTRKGNYNWLWIAE